MEHMFCYDVYVLLWGICYVRSLCSAMGYIFCCGVYVLLKSTFSVVEYVFC